MTADALAKAIEILRNQRHGGRGLTTENHQNPNCAYCQAFKVIVESLSAFQPSALKGVNCYAVFQRNNRGDDVVMVCLSQESANTIKRADEHGRYIQIAPIETISMSSDDALRRLKTENESDIRDWQDMIQLHGEKMGADYIAFHTGRIHQAQEEIRRINDHTAEAQREKTP